MIKLFSEVEEILIGKNGEVPPEDLVRRNFLPGRAVSTTQEHKFGTIESGQSLLQRSSTAKEKSLGHSLCFTWSILQI